MSKTSNLKYQLSGLGLYWLSQLVRKTCKFQSTNLDRMESVLSGERSVIITGWHGITMMAVPFYQRHHPDISNFVELMPDDSRGASLGVWADKMGVTTYPMNLTGDPSLGMARQVVRLVRKIMRGKSLFINPDGPDGPAHVVKPGIIYIARKAEAIILPMGAYCRRAYILPRWDRYTVPLPFSRIVCHIGEPIEQLPEDNDLANKLLTDTINQVTLQAAADYYELEHH